MKKVILSLIAIAMSVSAFAQISISNDTLYIDGTIFAVGEKKEIVLISGNSYKTSSRVLFKSDYNVQPEVKKEISKALKNTYSNSNYATPSFITYGKLDFALAKGNITMNDAAREFGAAGTHLENSAWAKVIQIGGTIAASVVAPELGVIVGVCAIVYDVVETYNASQSLKKAATLMELAN